MPLHESPLTLLDFVSEERRVINYGFSKYTGTVEVGCNARLCHRFLCSDMGGFSDRPGHRNIYCKHRRVVLYCE